MVQMKWLPFCRHFFVIFSNESFRILKYVPAITNMASGYSLVPSVNNLNQCWPIFMMLFGITRSQWENAFSQVLATSTFNFSYHNKYEYLKLTTIQDVHTFHATNHITLRNPGLLQPVSEMACIYIYSDIIQWYMYVFIAYYNVLPNIYQPNIQQHAFFK